MCVDVASSFVMGGFLVVVSGSAITLIGMGVATFFPPAEVVMPFIEAGTLFLGATSVVTGSDLLWSELPTSRGKDTQTEFKAVLSDGILSRLSANN